MLHVYTVIKVIIVLASFVAMIYVFYDCWLDYKKEKKDEKRSL